MSVPALLVASLAGAAAGAWVAYLRWKDKRRPEPWVLLALTVAVGVLGAWAANTGYGALDGLGLTASWAGLAGPWPRALATAAGIGLVEETAKLLPVAAVALASDHFDELWDGPVYAGAAGIGFALAETGALLAGGELGLVEGLARAVAAPITHALFAAPAGLGLAHAVLARRWPALPAGLAVSAGAHGLYDLFLARPGLQPGASAVVLVLWIWLLWRAREVLRTGR